jgi:hypothetical protein
MQRASWRAERSSGTIKTTELTREGMSQRPVALYYYMKTVFFFPRSLKVSPPSE